MQISESINKGGRRETKLLYIFVFGLHRHKYMLFLRGEEGVITVWLVSFGSFGPILQGVHLGCGSAWLNVVKLLMETQIGAA